MVVSVGGVPPAHLVARGHVTVRLPVPSCVRNRVIVWPAIAPEYVNVVLLFSVIMKMVPDDQFTVRLLPLLPVVIVSTKTLIVSVPEMTALLNVADEAKVGEPVKVCEEASSAAFPLNTPLGSVPVSCDASSEPMNSAATIVELGALNTAAPVMLIPELTLRL